MTDTYKYQARLDFTCDRWHVEDRTDDRHWSVTFSPLGEPDIVNDHTGRSLSPYGPTGRPIVNAVRRALEAEAKKDAHETRTAALNAHPKPRVKINITSDAVEEFKKAKARIEAHEKFRACYGR